MREFKGKRTRARGYTQLVDFAAVFPALADRRWRSVREIVAGCAGVIPPEKAARFYLRTTERKHPETVTPEDLVRLGTRAIIGHFLSNLAKRGVVQRRGAQRSVEFRLVRWYCWNCGNHEYGTPQPDRLCDHCHTVSIHEEE